MGAPRHLPLPAIDDASGYSSPDVVPTSWMNRRPGDLACEQPSGGFMGYQGPDQGFALRLRRAFREQLRIGEGEHLEDVESGCVQIALKRASIFGRAPVIHDLEIAYRVWGFLDDEADPRLVRERSRWFEGVSETHHYSDVRRLVAIVSSETLQMSPDAVRDQYASDWKALLELP